MWETHVQSQVQEEPLAKGMATHSSILAWRIPRTEEPVGLQSMGSHALSQSFSSRVLIGKQRPKFTLCFQHDGAFPQWTLRLQGLRGQATTACLLTVSASTCQHILTWLVDQAPRCCCCGSVAKLYPTLCDSMDWSTPRSVSPVQKNWGKKNWNTDTCNLEEDKESGQK